MSDNSNPEERRAPSGEATPASNPTVPPGERTGPYQPPPAEGLPDVPGYEVLGELGRGGMGVVYKARQVGLDRLVALKVVLAGAHADAEDLARFRREAEAIARLHHPNVVEIYEVGEQGDVPHFAMELCGGGSLAQRLAGGPLAPRRAAELVETLARAVQAAHEAGVVHRDLKPANVLLAEDGTPKITDFGLAKRLDGTTELTATGAIVGTASYMAPEQASGDSKRVGPAADVYALGAVLYACLTGRPPFRAGTQVDTLLQVVADPPTPPSQLRPGVPADLEAICLRCLEKKPAQRFASATELADALRGFLDGLPAQVRPRDDRPRDDRPRRPVGCTTAVLATLAGVLLLVFGLSLRFALRNPPPHQLGEGKPVWALGGSGPLLASGVKWGNVRDIRTGQVTASLPGWTSYSALAFAHGSNLLAMGSAAGIVQVQDVSRKETEVREYQVPQPQPARRKAPEAPAPDAPVRALAFSRDDRTLTAAFADQVRRWDVATGEMLPPVRVRGMLSPDGQVVLGRSAAGFLELWDAATGKQRADLGNPGGPAELPRFSPDGRLLAAAARGGAVWLWDLDGSLERAALEGAGGEVRTLVFSSDGAALAVGTDQQVTVWDTHTRQPRAQLPAGSFDPVAVTPAGDRLFLQTQPAGRLRLVELPSGRVLGEAEGYTFFALSPAGDRLLTLDGSRKIQSWNAANFGPPAGPVWRTLLGLLVVVPAFGAVFAIVALVVFRARVQEGPAYLLAFSADGNTLASASAGSLKLWDVVGERLRGKLEMPPAPSPVSPGLFTRFGEEVSAYLDSLRRILALGFTPDGRTLVTLDARGDGRLWDVAEGRPKISFQLKRTIAAAALAPDGRTLAIVSGDQSAAEAKLTLWDVDPAGRVSRRVTVPVPRLRPEGSFPVFVAAGRGLAFLSRVGLKLWDVVPGGLRERPVPEREGTGALALSPDGRLVALYVYSKKQGITRITFWDLATDRVCGDLGRRGGGILPGLPRGLNELPSSLTFAPDGRVAVGFGGSDPGGLWDPRTGRPLGDLRRKGEARTTAVAFSPDGRTLAVGDAAGGVTWLEVDAAVRAARKAADTLAEQGWRGAVAQLASLIREAVEEVAQGGVRPPAGQKVGDPDSPPRSDAPTVPPSSPRVPPAESRVEVRVQPPPAQGYPQVPGYEVLEELGRGGMGVVYQARQVGLDRLVALKVLPSGAHASPDELARFRREAEAIARLHHPNVVGIYEVGECAGSPYFSMELCTGGSLAQRLARGPLPPHEAARLTAALARGIQAAHNVGVIHRDLKPANVLLAADGTPRITDFGLAKKLDDATGMTASGVVLGTPTYMAPEQASGRAKEAGPAADVYALGAVLYACLTGRPPFQAATPLDTILQVLSDPPVPPSRLRRQVPAALEAICLKCLEKDPHRRYASAAALAADLERFVTGGFRSRKLPRYNLERLAWRFLGRTPRVLGRAACAVLALALPCLLIGHAIPERTPRAEFPAAARARLSPDGSRLLVVGAREAFLYDTFTGKQLAAYEAPAGFSAETFSPDGGTLALGEAGGETEVWDLRSHTSRDRFRAHNAPIHALAFRPDGRLVAGRGKATEPAGEVEAVWCGEPGRAGLLLAHAGLLSPDGRWLVEDTADGLRLWDTATGRSRTTLPVKPEPGLQLAFSPDGATLATAPSKANMQLWDTATGNERARPPFQTRSLLFSPDGRLLLVDGALWDVAMGQQRGWLRSFRYAYRPLGFSPDGRSLVAHASSQGSSSLALLEPSTGQERTTVGNGRLQKPPEQMDPFGFVAVSADGRTLMTGYGAGPPDGRLRVWDWEPYWRGKPLVAGLRRIGWVAVYLGLGLGGLGGLVWVAASLKARRRVLALAFRPDGRALALGRADGSLRLLDLDSEEVRVLVTGGYGPGRPDGLPFKPRVPAVHALAFRKRAEGEELAVLDAAGDVTLWGPETSQQPKPVLTVGRVTTAAFSSDGRWLAGAAGGWPLVWQSTWARRAWRLLRLAGRPAPAHRVWLWDLSPEAQLAAASRNTRPAGSPGDEVETRVRRRVEALIWPIEKTHLQGQIMLIGRIVAVALIAWSFSIVMLHFEIWSGLVVTSIVCPVPVVFALWLRNTGLARRVVRQFNREFPEQVAERSLALEILAGHKCRASFMKKIKKALSVPPNPGGIEGLSSSQGVSVATDARFFSVMTFAPAAPAFAALTETGLRLYRLEADGRLSEQSLAGAEVDPRAVPAFTPDGRFLVVRLRDGSLKAWEVATGRPWDDVSGPASGLALVYAPDGRSAVTVNADGTAILWDVGAGKEQAVLEMDEPPNVTVFAPAEAARRPEDVLQHGVRRAAFSPDGRTLALADGAGSVAWCDVAEVRRTAGCRPGWQRRKPNGSAWWAWLRSRLLELLPG
jgi:serine/threonine protein kinase/WD40 repeat protein